MLGTVEVDQIQTIAAQTKAQLPRLSRSFDSKEHSLAGIPDALIPTCIAIKRVFNLTVKLRGTQGTTQDFLIPIRAQKFLLRSIQGDFRGAVFTLKTDKFQIIPRDNSLMFVRHFG